MNKPVVISIRYKLPTMADTDTLLASVTPEQFEQIRAIAEDRVEPAGDNIEDRLALALPELGTFLALTLNLYTQLEEDRAVNPAAHRTPVRTAAENTILLSTLRDRFGSSPKQVAKLLNCYVGYFADAEDPQVNFSLTRFTPTANFYEMNLEG